MGGHYFEAKIHSDAIKSIYTSIPKRIRAVIKAKGYITNIDKVRKIFFY